MNPASAEGELGQWIFAGSWTTPVPHGLVLDRRLTSGDKILWQVLRFSLPTAQSNIKPTYDWLATLTNLSRSSIARGLKALQLTGWAGVKNIKTGEWMVGNQYALYDDDKSASFAGESPYRQLVADCLTKAGRLSKLARTMLVQLAIPERDLPASSVKKTPSRFKKTLPSVKLTPPENSANSRGVKMTLPSSVKKTLPENARSSNLTLPRNTQSNQELNAVSRAREGAGSSCSSSSFLTSKEKENTTTTTARALVWPIISDATRKTGERELMAVKDDPLAQQVLDEFAAAIGAGKARNPTTYLRALIHAAVRGDFSFTDDGQRVAASRQRSTPTETQARDADRRIDELCDALFAGRADLTSVLRDIAELGMAEGRARALIASKQRVYGDSYV